MEKLHPKLLQAHDGWKPKGKKTKWLRNHRKMAKKHAKKTGYTKKWKSFKNQDARKMGGRKWGVVVHGQNQLFPRLLFLRDFDEHL